MAAIKNLSTKNPLLTYFVLAFLISWGAIFIGVGPSGFPVTADQLPVLIVAMLLGPSAAAVLAAILTAGKDGFRDLFKRLGHWRVSPWWYAVALVTAPLSTLVVLLILALFSSGFPTALATTDDKATLVMMWVVSGILVGLLEELGWTGFAIPKMLKKRGVFSTGLIVGLVWGAWHFLVNWEADTFTGLAPLILLIARLFTWLPAYRVLMVWVYDRTESQLVVTLMHISLVATTGILDPVLTGTSLVTFLLTKAAVLWLLAIAIMLIRKRRGIQPVSI